MKKFVAILTALMFALSLSLVAVAQEKAPAPTDKKETKKEKKAKKKKEKKDKKAEAPAAPAAK